MQKENEIIQSLKYCPHYRVCSINICPADLEVRFRTKLPEEQPCPFTIKRRTKALKGIKTLAPDSLLKVIPEPNAKMLNKRNFKRWCALHQAT